MKKQILEWHSIEQLLPEENTTILIKYHKGNKARYTSGVGDFIIQGKMYKSVIGFGTGKRDGIIWEDYSGRLIVLVPADSKNKIIAWAYLN